MFIHINIYTVVYHVITNKPWFFAHIRCLDGLDAPLANHELTSAGSSSENLWGYCWVPTVSQHAEFFASWIPLHQCPKKRAKMRGKNTVKHGKTCRNGRVKHGKTPIPNWIEQLLGISKGTNPLRESNGASAQWLHWRPMAGRHLEDLAGWNGQPDRSLCWPCYVDLCYVDLC